MKLIINKLESFGYPLVKKSQC